MIKNQKSEYQMTDEEYHAWLGYMYYTAIVAKVDTSCYACATGRHSCSHDASDDAPRSEEFEQ
tara:strand:- start:3296 stop:3484 length:189 start_codon:yes stop_codon:yes gene_type:complete